MSVLFSRRLRWLWLCLLLLTALAVRIHRARTLPVVSPDTIRFIDQARALWVHAIDAEAKQDASPESMPDFAAPAPDLD